MLKTVHKVIQFNQKLWLKPFIDINTKLRTKARNDFEKDVSKLMNNSVFGKTMENVRKDKNVKPATTYRRRNYLNKLSFISNRNKKKIKVKANKPVYLDLSTLEISKTLIHEFWYDYIKPKYQHNAKLFYQSY